MRFTALCFFFLFSFMSSAQAELVELGLSGNYRRTFFADSNDETEQAKDEMQALTVSISYYLKDMTALEFSFTSGESVRTIPSSTISTVTTHNYSLLGADFVYTFAKKTDPYIPYIKVGVGYFLNKKINYVYVNNTTPAQNEDRTVELDPTLVPSAGFGLKTKVTDNFMIRFGLEVWTSGPIDSEVDELDWAARVGVSWFL